MKGKSVADPQTSEHSGASLRHGVAAGLSYIERPGDGPAVIFLHGIGSGAQSFAALFDHLPQGARLIAWNAPGYRDSEQLAEVRPVAAEYAQALARFLDALGLEAVHLVGHSLGTLVASAFAVALPRRVASLTLAASAQGYGITDEMPLPAKAAQRLEDLKAEGAEAFARSRAPRLVYQPERNPDCVTRVGDEMARINPAGYAQAVHMLASGDLAASVAAVPFEPGFIIGAEDRVTPFDQTRAAADAWRDAHGAAPRIVTIPEAGHAVYVQAPAAFAKALTDLVPAIGPRTPSHAEGERHA